MYVTALNGKPTAITEFECMLKEADVKCFI